MSGFFPGFKYTTISPAPTVSAAAGSTGTATCTGSTCRIGDTVFWTLDVTVTAAGDWTGNLKVAMPDTANKFGTGSAIDAGITGKEVFAYIPAASNLMNFCFPDATTIIATGRELIASGSYRVA